MKKLFTLLITIILAHHSHAQHYDYCKLDPASSCQHHFIIDTANYPNNIWQIGKPQKTVFDSAFSLPYAIMTDTINSYPTNDTSVFIVKHTKSPWSTVSEFALSFYYRLDIDSGEIAKVEVSGDSGLHWIDVIREDTTYDFVWWGSKPRLDTSTHLWEWFSLHMGSWRNAAYYQKTYPSYISADTFLYRFTFISNATQTNKEGWMMDNFFFEDWISSVEDLQNDNLIDIYPNPSGGHITIKQNAVTLRNAAVTIYNLQGQEVYYSNSIPQNGQLDLSLPDGIYYLKYLADEQYAVKKITIIN